MLAKIYANGRLCYLKCTHIHTYIIIHINTSWPNQDVKIVFLPLTAQPTPLPRNFTAAVPIVCRPLVRFWLAMPVCIQQFPSFAPSFSYSQPLSTLLLQYFTHQIVAARPNCATSLQCASFHSTGQRPCAGCWLAGLSTFLIFRFCILHLFYLPTFCFLPLNTTFYLCSSPGTHSTCNKRYMSFHVATDCRAE